MKKLPLTWVFFLLISNLANGQYNTPVSLALREITPLEEGIFRIKEFRTDSSLAYRGYLSSAEPLFVMEIMISSTKKATWLSPAAITRTFLLAPGHI